MRSFSLAATIMSTLALLSSTLATPTVTPQSLSHLNIPRTSLTERAITIPICIQLDVELNLADALQTLADESSSGGGLIGGIVGGLVGSINDLLNSVIDLNLDLGSLCLCATVDGLTPDTLAQVTTAVDTNGNTGLLGALADIVPDVVTFISPLLLGLIEDNSPSEPQCMYPDGATPLAGDNCGASCDFACPDGQDRCGDTCIPAGDPCSTTVSTRKRSVRERSRYACRQPFTACPVSHFLARDTAASYGGGFECIDTTADLESCGGCINPFKGNVAGEDCTAITNVDSVACTVGKCVVESCAPGFVPSTDATSCVAKSLFSSSRLTVQSRKSRK